MNLNHSSPPVQPSTEAAQIHNLPRLVTPFIGRADELVELNRLLIEPECRMLTLVGPGGGGKTRLACQAAQDLAADFPDGIYFVPLETLDSNDLIPLAIADAIGFHPNGPDNPESQLLMFLRGLHLLLILDNFDHLIEAADLTTRMLEAAPRLKILITSREVLNLRDEWIFTLRGLSYPDVTAFHHRLESELNSSMLQYDAVKMFSDHARRVRRNFSPESEIEQILTICQLVDGNPLALELAAAWARTLSCQVIAQEIQRSQNFLATTMRDVPDRHRSLQAIFDQSWKMLNREERSVFKLLSVFQGGFQPEAAEMIAAASLPVLASLTGKSLLSWYSNGRFAINPLLRSYAAKRLAESPQEVLRMNDLHCNYYTDFLHTRLEELLGGQQMVAAQEIETELENVRAAWTWAVDHSKVQAIKNAIQALDTFFQFQSRYKEGLEAMRRAAASLEKIKPSQARDLTLAEVLVCQGWLSIRLGDFTGAQTSLQASQDLFTRFELPFPPGLGTDPQIPLSLLAALQGDYNQAVKLGEQALKACIADKELNNLPVIHYVLASAWSSMGDYTQANHHARLACQIVSEAHNRWMLAYCLNAWGGIELKLGNYDQAKDNYLASYEIRKDFADPEGMAVALNHLGVIELRRENFNQSRQLFERSLALYEKLDDVGGLATTINGLAFASTGLGEYSRANREFHRALQLASGIQYISLTIWVLIGIGNLFCKTGRIVRGLDLLRLANHHPASEREAVERSQEFIDRELRDPSAGSWAKSEVAEQKLTLESVVAELLVDLTRMDFSNLETGSLLKPQNHPEQKLPTQQLIDPLTDRELEVLRLLALGLANREIAVKLFLSVGTVKWYTGQVYQKLQVGNRTQAVARGREIGLLD